MEEPALSVGVWIVVVLLMAAGVAGSVLPVLPGPPLVVAGALVHAIATDFTPIGAGRLAMLAALAGLAYVLEYGVTALGARRLGGSRWGMAGAVIGGVVGLFLGPLGLLIGPLLGAIAGELLATGELERGVRSGLGAALGAVAGVVLKLAVSVTMVGLFAWWVWRS
jgi:uncharacterized protein YqgC (DUF456 family)